MEITSDNFVSRYLKRVSETDSILCVGVDPTPDHVPPSLRTADILQGLRRYLWSVVDIAATRVPVIKPQIAYYAALGSDGLELLQELIVYAKSLGLLVILDAKRTDIGSTMEQYGEEVFGKYGADACTSMPYLGPTFNPSWMKWLGQGCMVIPMIRTSNPEAATIQDLELKHGKLLYEHVAQLVAGWNVVIAEITNGVGSVGGVVGATWPEQAVRCRKFADGVFFLVPGYGEQDGGAKGAVGGLLNSTGEPMGTVNSARGITLSWLDKELGQPREGQPYDHVERAIKAANIDLNAALER